MDPTLVAQWAPKRCQPQLFSDSTRERVNLCGIVDIDTMDAMVQKIPKERSPRQIEAHRDVFLCKTFRTNWHHGRDKF